MDDDWDQIGIRLRHAREAADLVLEDITHQTRIPRTIVEALEAENFSVFTSPTYAKSFLRQYSDFLGVDAKPWLDALEPAFYVRGEVLQPIFESAADIEEPQTSQRREKHMTTSSGFSSMWMMVLSGGLLFGAVMLYQFVEKKFDEPAPVSAEAPKASEPVEKKSSRVEEDKPVENQSDDPKDPVVKTPETSTGAPRAIIVRD